MEEAKFFCKNMVDVRNGDRNVKTGLISIRDMLKDIALK